MGDPRRRVALHSVAVFCLRVGREIESAALIAGGYHARTDGLTSLTVVAGVAGVWLGYPLADLIVGLIITIAIFGIVWQSTKAVFTRLNYCPSAWSSPPATSIRASPKRPVQGQAGRHGPGRRPQSGTWRG